MGTTTAKEKMQSCRCLTKTPEAKYHDVNCPYRLLDEARKEFERIFLYDFKANPKMLEINDRGNYEEDIELAYRMFCRGIKFRKHDSEYLMWRLNK